LATSHVKRAVLRCVKLYCIAIKICQIRDGRAMKEPNMIFSNLFAQLKTRLSKRAEFHRLIEDINSLSTNDLIDMRANRAEMVHQAYLQVYGDRNA
jgi:hypothetical protein